jgi:hypothetical protein
MPFYLLPYLGIPSADLGGKKKCKLFISSYNFRQPLFISPPIVDYDSNNFDDTSTGCVNMHRSHTLQPPPPNIRRTGYLCNGYQNISTTSIIKRVGVCLLLAVRNDFAGTPMEASLEGFITRCLHRVHAKKIWPKLCHDWTRC